MSTTTTTGTQLVALLIAGDPAEARRYGLRLEVDGYTLAAATDLEGGLAMAASLRPDLVFVCLGAWAVPALVLLVLRADPATAGLPVVLVSDLTRSQLAAEVGGLRPTEHVVSRHGPLLATEAPTGARARSVPAGRG